MTAIPARPDSRIPAARNSLGSTGASAIRAGLALLALTPVATSAMGLGEITVRSTLGQPLDATVPLQLGPGESLAGQCVGAGTSGGTLRNLPQPRIATPQTSRPGEYLLSISTPGALHEPMYELSLVVKCPGAPVLVRQYVLMLDLPGTNFPGDRISSALLPAMSTRESPPLAGAAPNADAPLQPAPQPVPRRARPASDAARTPVTVGTRYRVGTGDTLSLIAARVSGRGTTLRDMADRIFRANPDAFIRNNPDLIKLGSEILIPASEAAPAAATPTAPPVPAQIAGVDTGLPALPPGTAPGGRATRAVPADTEIRAASVGDTAAAVAPVVAGPVAAAPEPAAAPDTTIAANEPAPVSDARDGGDRSAAASPLFATTAGIVFGLLVSSLLWSRRIRDLVRGRRAAPPAVRPQERDRSPDTVATSALAAKTASSRQIEPAISVSYAAADEDPLAAEFAYTPTSDGTPVAGPGKSPGQSLAEDLTSELADLFDGNGSAGGTTSQQAVIPPSLSAGGMGVDVLLGDGEDTRLAGGTVETGSWHSPTIQTSAIRNEATSASGTFDIHALASADGGDTNQAQTLMEALTLLERDYEEELTASQVIDMSAIRGALATEDTVVGKDRSKKSR